MTVGCCRHASVLGVRVWAASRMVEMAFKRFMTLLSGTWAMNVYLRALGASVGDWVSFRLGMCLPLCPDQLVIKDGCASLPFSTAGPLPSPCFKDPLQQLYCSKASRQNETLTTKRDKQ